MILCWICVKIPWEFMSVQKQSSLLAFSSAYMLPRTHQTGHFHKVRARLLWAISCCVLHERATKDNVRSSCVKLLRSSSAVWLSTVIKQLQLFISQSWLWIVHVWKVKSEHRSFLRLHVNFLLLYTPMRQNIKLDLQLIMAKATI